MVDPFQSANALLARASHHIDELQSEIYGFHRRSTGAPFSEIDPETGETLFKVKVTGEIPVEIACILFDAVNCLRSSLDHAVYSAAIAITNIPEPSNTKFPLGDNAEEARVDFVRKKPPRGLDGLKDYIIDELQPYNGGGGQTLWSLNKLRNGKIHRILAPTMTRQNRGIVGGKVKMVKVRVFQLWDREKEELTFMSAETVEGDPQFDVRIGVALIESTPFPRMDVGSLIPQLHEATAAAVRGIEQKAAELA